MPVPPPAEGTALTTPPDAAEVAFMTRGFVSAVAPDGGLRPMQRLLLEAVSDAMTGFPMDHDPEPITPRAYAEGLARRDMGFRARMVQVMLLAELVLSPLPEEVADRVTAFASELGVDDEMLRVTREFAHGSLGLAAVDFARNGYVPDLDARVAALGRRPGPDDDPWGAVAADPALAARWAALEDLPAGTLGHQVWRFYRARGFTYPGTPGSAPPLLAQHDWVHVLADYGTTVESELEVFALISRANDDPRAFSLLAMVVSLFETGYLASGAGLFQADRGHLSHAGVAVRLADGLRRGALCTDTRSGESSIDFLAIDWFSLADRPVEVVRTELGMVPRSEAARAAGSVGPWEPGGISPFQLAAGQAMAAAEGRPYDPYGAAVGDPAG